MHLSSCASRRVETNPAPQKPRCIDVACSTQLSKSGPARSLTSGPHAGAQPGTRRQLLTPPVSPGCRTLKADSTTVQPTNLGYVAADVKREDFEKFEPLLTTHRQARVNARLGGAVFPLPPRPEVALQLFDSRDENNLSRASHPSHLSHFVVLSWEGRPPASGKCKFRPSESDYLGSATSAS